MLGTQLTSDFLSENKAKQTRQLPGTWLNKLKLMNPLATMTEKE